jgi:AGZA family xanthine/uracil permease-like MFS transporter
MFKSVKKINLTDLEESIPAFLTIIIMPFTGSIGIGLTFGFLSYVLVKILAGKAREIPIILWVIGLLSLVNLIIGL